jgi:lipopolysaccharide biosynthesis regulator YciM
MVPTISFEVWVILLLFLAVIILAFYSVYTRKKVVKEEDKPYVQALKYMAEGENRLAVEKFKEAVRENSANIDAYIKLGTILRNEGLYKNAIRIHKDLTLRGNLEPAEVMEVKRNLVLDYWYTKDYKKSEIYLNQLIENKNFIDWAAPYLVKIYEERDDWKAAFEILNKSTLSQEDKGKIKLAELKVKQGQKLVEEEKEKDARILFKEALKINSECAESYLLLGDSYLRENRRTDAINAWSDLCKKVPEKAHLAFDRLEKAWFEKGHFSKIEELYASILEKDPDYLPAIIALSEIYRKKGEHNQSLKILQEAQKKEVDSVKLQSQLVRVYIEESQFKEAANLALDIIDQSTP